MIETAFLMIVLNGGPVTVKPNYEELFAVNPIPERVVRECAEYSGVDPYNIMHMNDIMKELDLLDCFFYDVGDHEHNIYSKRPRVL